MTIAASPGQLLIEPDDLFIVTNNSHGPFDPPFDKWDGTITLIWNHRSYIIPPGEHRSVPFDAVRKHFGDPRSVPHVEQKYEDRDGNKGNIATRSQEVDRLCVLYGLYAGNEVKLPDHPMVKDVVIETIDRIEIFCPAVDPDGSVGIYAHRESNDRVQDTASMLQLMERRLNQQQALIDQLRGSDANDEPDDEQIGIDRPRFPEP